MGIEKETTRVEPEDIIVEMYLKHTRTDITETDKHLRRAARLAVKHSENDLRLATVMRRMQDVHGKK